MKLASKLKKLIHLAEHARLNEAQAQVRMAHESAEARAELGAGRAGGQSLEEDNMHIERLHEEVLREVQQKVERPLEQRESKEGSGQVRPRRSTLRNAAGEREPA